MKIKLLIMLLLVSISFGLTLNYMTDETIPLEPAQTAANRIEYRAFMDSASYNIWQHKTKTANHDYADSATYYLTANDSCYGTADNLTQAIKWAISFYEYLTDHYAADSSHCGAADNVTVLPKLITVNATYPQFHNFVDSCLISMNNHFGRVADTRYKILGKEAVADFIAHCAKPTTTRYNILGKEAVADFIAHCAKDTSDSDSVHWVPDITFNTITYDSTNIDSSYASWIRLRSRWHGHIQAALGDGTKPHKEYTNEDSMTFSGNPSNKIDLILFANEFKTKYNQHVARAYTAETDSVHYLADANLITTASIATTEAPHWTPDVTYNTITFDSTNVDSVFAGWNRVKSRFNSHIAVAGTGGSDPHQSYTNADSVTAANATNLATLYDLIADYKAKYNQHIARTGTVHYTADTGAITGATLVKGKGHIEADTNTYSDNAFVNWSTWPFSYCLIQYTGSSVTHGASFYKYGSLDGKNYAYIDSTSVTADGAKMDSMAWFPWVRIILNKRTDGTYKVDFKGAK
jgi:hypothetical protein